jgi:Fungal protein kinase
MYRLLNTLRYYRGGTELTTADSVRSRNRRKAIWTTKTSIYLSITGSKPYIIGGQVKGIQYDLRAELKGSYGEPNPRLLDKFFPYPKPDSSKADLEPDVNPSQNNDILPNLKESYGDTSRPSAKNANDERTENLTQGWKGIPVPPVHAEQPNIQEKDITTALVPIINAIISHQELSDCRVAIDRQQNPIRTFGGNFLKPDIFLWGKGTPAFPDASGIPPPTTPSAKNRKTLSAEEKALGQAPPVEWQWCVIPIEVKTERTRYANDNQGMFQLATYVREIFAAQPHRRFVPSLLFTESTVEFFLWDRAGVVYSEALDYHAEAARFCHIIATIVSWNDEELGLDTSVCFANDVLHIWTSSDAYIVDPVVPVVQSYNIRSHGTTCWRARKSDHLDAHIYLILDTWSSNWVCDDMIRLTVEDIRLKNPLLSPAEWVSFNAVHTSYTVTGLHRSRQYVDSVDTNRRLVGVADNLDHGRSVWRCSGNECVPLQKFHSLLELVYALRDVARGISNYS